MPNQNRIINKLLRILLCTLLPLSLQAEETSSSSINTLALMPLTGSAAEQGQWILDGLRLGTLEAEKRYASKVNLLIEDSAADPKQALSAYQKIKSTQSLSVVYSYGSGVGVALSPIVNRDHIVQIGLATATPAYRSANDFTLRNFPAAELDSQFIIEQAKKYFTKAKVAILNINNEFGVTAAASFKKLWLESEGEIVYEDSIDAGSSDFRSQLLKLKSKSPSLIYLALYPTEGAIILKQSAELGINARKIASVAILGGENFFKIAGKGADGLLVSSATPVFLESQDLEVQNFVKAYKETYQEEPGLQHLYAARAYDTAMLVGELSLICGADTTCLREKLHQTKNYQGASGVFSFDKNGDIQTNFTLQEVFQGKFRTPDF